MLHCTLGQKICLDHTAVTARVHRTVGSASPGFLRRPPRSTMDRNPFSILDDYSSSDASDAVGGGAGRRREPGESSGSEAGPSSRRQEGRRRRLRGGNAPPAPVASEAVPQDSCPASAGDVDRRSVAAATALLNQAAEIVRRRGGPRGGRSRPGRQRNAPEAMLADADDAELALTDAEVLLRGQASVVRLLARSEALRAEASLLRAEAHFCADRFDDVFPLGVAPAMASVATARRLLDGLLAEAVTAAEAGGGAGAPHGDEASTVVELLGEAIRDLLARADARLARLDAALHEAEEGRAAARAAMGEEAWRSRSRAPGWEGQSAAALARQRVSEEFAALLRLRGELVAALPAELQAGIPEAPMTPSLLSASAPLAPGAGAPPAPRPPLAAAAGAPPAAVPVAAAAAPDRTSGRAGGGRGRGRGAGRAGR